MIVLTTPPLVNSETIRRSPSTWLPVNEAVLPPPTPGGSITVQPTVASWRNQKPTLASPLFLKRSKPKSMIVSPLAETAA